jgi:hypothetical protein
MKMYYTQLDVSDLRTWVGNDTDTPEDDDIQKSDYMPSEDDIPSRSMRFNMMDYLGMSNRDFF